MAMSLAEKLLAQAVAEGQCAHRIAADDDVPALRAEIRRLARAQNIRIRSGIIDESIVAVATIESPLWREPTAIMRQKLTP